MRETVSRLVALQGIDDEARGYKQERQDLQEKIGRLKELLELMKAGLEEKKEKLAEATRWYKEKDSELKADQDKVLRAKTKLQTVTKNKEYMAMQKEIEALRKVNATREEEILKLLEAIEQFKQSIASEQEKIAELTAEVKTEEESNADRIAELDKHIAEIDARKGEVVHGLKPALLSRYRRIFKARDGVAVVPVRNGACTGCNFSLPPQQVVRIQKGTTLETCRNCSRVIYWPDEVEDQSDEATAESATA